MRPRRVFLHLALVLLFAAFVPLRPAAASADPSAFMVGIGNRVLDIINDKRTSDAQHREQFLQLADQSFDVPKIAQFVLGRYWRSASDDEKARFIQAFKTYMVQVYWSRFNSYDGETFQVTNTKDEGNGTILVTTEILRTESGKPPVKVSWSLVSERRRASRFATPASKA